MKLKNNKLILIFSSVLLTFFLAGCPGSKRDETELLRLKIDSIRTEARSFLVESNQMAYENWVLGKELKIASLYSSHKGLFDVSSINIFNRSLKFEQRPERVDKINRLKVFVYNEIVNRNSIGLSEKIENFKNSGKIYLEGKIIPYYSATQLLANESKPKKREIIYSQLSEFLKKLNPVLLEKFFKNRSQIDSLGFKNFNQFSEMIREINFQNFSTAINGYLNSTENMYFSLLEDILKANKLSTENFYRYDIPKIRRTDKYDKYFKKDSLINIWKITFGNMGFIIDSINNLSLNTENIPTKNPRAACFPIDIPKDIKMSIKPTGGINDFAALFHESGHGLHFAFTTEKDFEYQYLYNYTATETYSFLFENILDEPEWIKQHFSMKDAELKNLMKFRAFSRLYMTRRYCAKFLYEMQLSDSINSAPKKYSEILSTYLGYKATELDEQFYLDDVDDFFYVVDYLRAWFIEAMIKTKLREEFGENWFNNNKIAETLIDFFQDGQKFTIDTFIKKIGFTDLDPKFLSNEINSMIQFAKSK